MESSGITVGQFHGLLGSWRCLAYGFAKDHVGDKQFLSFDLEWAKAKVSYAACLLCSNHMHLLELKGLAKITLHGKVA